MPTWPAKDPDAVQDFVFTIPLDEGDTVSSHTFERLAGTVVIDSEARDGADVTAWLSGGAAGETSVFRVEWLTAGGRTNDAVITLLVAANEYEPLVLTGYEKPGYAHLTARYPAFADVAATTISFWLADAERYVDESWTEGDYAAAIMALAAHNMAAAGLGTDGGGISLPAGATRVKSASFEMTFSEGAANGRAAGSLSSTRYGAEFLLLKRRNHGGPRVQATGVLPSSGWPAYPHGQA